MVVASAARQDIINAVRDQLRWDESVDDAEINVDVRDDGTAVLTGYVPDFLGKQSAGIDAMLSPGVARVENRLIVNSPANPETNALADDEIRSRISQAFTLAGDIDASRLKTRSRLGHVTLEGTVDSYARLLQVLDIVSRVIGIVNITNAIAVVPGESFSDDLLARKAMERLENELDRDTLNDIAIEVKDGIVSLDGALPARNVWDRVHNAIASVEGIKGIDSRRLKVG